MAAAALKKLETLNYETTLNTIASHVTLVVPMVVADELDKLKVSGGGGRGGDKERDQTRRRARAALRFIEYNAGCW